MMADLDVLGNEGKTLATTVEVGVKLCPQEAGSCEKQLGRN